MRAVRKGLPSGALLVVSAVALAICSVYGQSTTTEPAPSTSARTVRFASPSLGYEYTFAILLPTTYAQGEKRYPVLYLLHPGGGSHTSFPARTWFNKHASARQMIVVLPNGNRSYFVNSASAPDARYEDVIVKDLIDYVDSHYRTVTSREGRAIAGISMGAFGAAVLGLKRPDLFATVGALSAPFAVARSEGASEGSPTNAIFGRPFTPERQQRDPLFLVTQVPTDVAPFFYISCGEQDSLIVASRQFVQLLADRKLPHEYSEIPGTHSWDVWDSQLPYFFDVLFGQPGWGTR